MLREEEGRRNLRDDLSRRDLSARPEEENYFANEQDDVTGFELGTQRSRELVAGDSTDGQVIDVNQSID